MTSRRLGSALIVAGVLVLAYAAAVVAWRDPVTDLYSRFQQHRLESALEAEFTAWSRDLPEGAGVALERATTARDARRFARGLEQGQAFGRLAIPAIGIDVVTVHGTRWGADLSRGPGHYERTEVPGLGRTVGIAGHRTTFGAPFRHIDDLESGDEITLEMPYATFTYRVVEHEIVASDDWSVIRDRGQDMLMLSACHPLYGSSERWIVYARLVEVQRGDESYTLDAR